MGLEVGSASVQDIKLLQLNSMGTNISDDPKDPDVKMDGHTDQQQHQEEPKKEDMQKAVDKLNQLITPHHTNLHFKFHEKLEKFYVQIVDSETKTVIKEIPSKKFLDAHAATLELLGFLVDKKA